MPNVHSHAFQRAMAGLAESSGAHADDFWTWREAMYRFLDTIGPDEMEAIAAFAFMEMLERGFTRVGEFHYVHHDTHGAPYVNRAELATRIAAASQEAGIALTLLPVMYAHANFGGATAALGQRRFVNDSDGFAQIFAGCRSAVAALEDAVIGVAPHSLRAVTLDELEATIGLAPHGPIHIHAAEQLREVEASIAWSGKRPVAWLLDNAPVDSRWCLIHATHVDEAEVHRLAASGAVAGLCPVTEANLGDGVFPATHFLDVGGRFGVGSDSNVLIGVVDELRALEYAQRLHSRSRNVLACSTQRSTGRRLYEAALTGGARALGVERSCLSVGAPADIVSLDMNHPSLIERHEDAVLDSWIFASHGNAIDCVWRRGRQVVSGGRHRDRERFVARYRQAVAKVLAAPSPRTKL